MHLYITLNPPDGVQPLTKALSIKDPSRLTLPRLLLKSSKLFTDGPSSAHLITELYWESSRERLDDVDCVRDGDRLVAYVEDNSLDN
jgi:hypothetical protein